MYQAKFYNSVTKVEFQATPYILMQYVATRQLPLVGCWILVFSAGLCITGFLGYHLYQIAQGIYISVLGIVIYICISVCMCVYVCVYLCMYVCMLYI